ncbi:MAG: DNA mismatch repair endonuclease MutL [Alphaproteobacteria bacterium]|nr:DNA mismatch repair endonuclease MutL [Alphaproteobacteria bacterium]
MAKIKLLSDDLINQIAAGEVVEKPASALKELVENALDAKAQNIKIFLQNGGKSKIVVQDDGEGLDKDDLSMAIMRHATSKLTGDNLFDIRSYGFRGEALPSIASVSSFTLESRGAGINVDFSKMSDIFPSTISKGARVTVQNLFEKIPARLKFLKSDSVELTACLNVIENISLICPKVNFSINTDEKQILSFINDTIEARISKILGTNVFKKAIKFAEKEEHIAVEGWLFHPLDNRYSQAFQKVFINKRVVKDKTVSLAIRNAYKDLIPAGRFAIAVIFIDIDPFYLDANISPTKSEVRFRDTVSVQKFLVNSFRKHLKHFDRVSNEFELINLAEQSLASNVVHTPVVKPNIHKFFQSPKPSPQIPAMPMIEGSLALDTFSDYSQEKEQQEDVVQNRIEVLSPTEKMIYGEPIAQVFNAYIITETENGIMIIDQHAVHEKITQHKIIKNLTQNNKQYLIKPELIELSDSECEVAKSILDKLTECGFVIEVIQKALMISAIPSIITTGEAKQFIKDIVVDEKIVEELEVLDLIRKKIADKACHNSIRFGRKLSQDEMREILHQMSETPTIHQCNHHRTSFITITKEQLEKMFDR